MTLDIKIANIFINIFSKLFNINFVGTLFIIFSSLTIISRFDYAKSILIPNEIELKWIYFGTCVTGLVIVCLEFIDDKLGLKTIIKRYKENLKLKEDLKNLTEKEYFIVSYILDNNWNYIHGLSYEDVISSLLSKKILLWTLEEDHGLVRYNIPKNLKKYFNDQNYGLRKKPDFINFRDKFFKSVTTITNKRIW